MWWRWGGNVNVVCFKKGFPLGDGEVVVGVFACCWVCCL